MGKKAKLIISKNVVSILFAVLCVITFFASKVSFSYFLQELIIRIVRNGILVLALIIPAIAGLGLNFSIVLGAMAAQTSLILITHWHIGGVLGIFVACLIAIPLSTLLGWLMGQLFNRTKGQEMITGMIAGYFANGIYQFIFIVLLGSVIPFHDTNLMLSSGVGVKSTIVLEGTKSLDELFSIRCDLFILFIGVGVAAVLLALCLRNLLISRKHPEKRYSKEQYIGYGIIALLLLLIGILSQCNAAFNKLVNGFFVPASTVIVVAVFSVFCIFITKTKLGQDFRSVGRDMKVAAAAGINVDRVRITAIIISTVLAGIGQVISLQNIGSFSTYSAHDSVATYAIAALLVGGATVKDAKVRNVFIGLTLFHALFIAAPQAGMQLFGNSMYGEYFRVFISYGIIAMSLILNAVQTRNLKMRQLRAATRL